MYTVLYGSVKNDNPKLNGIDLSNRHAPVPVNYTNSYQGNYYDGVAPGFKTPESIEISSFQSQGCRGYSFCSSCQVVTSSVCQCLGVCGKCNSHYHCKEIPNGFFTHYYNRNVNGIYRFFDNWPKMQFYPIKRKEN